ncbi:MAG: hypothetical protein RMJ38_01940 [candidate division WOR-3 bacterium]|nr:T9SS type A sorting domain-containing protein [candidate division WOR-3 bacterium]MDW8150192.1 hypothetical protein [candidate division WOR-3 bacterium]
MLRVMSIGVWALLLTISPAQAEREIHTHQPSVNDPNHMLNVQKDIFNIESMGHKIIGVTLYVQDPYTNQVGSDGRYMVERANELFNSGNRDEAIRILEEFSRKYPKAILMYQHVPKNPDNRGGSGTLWLPNDVYVSAYSSGYRATEIAIDRDSKTGRFHIITSYRNNNTQQSGYCINYSDPANYTLWTIFTCWTFTHATNYITSVDIAVKGDTMLALSGGADGGVGYWYYLRASTTPIINNQPILAADANRAPINRVVFAKGHAEGLPMRYEFVFVHGKTMLYRLATKQGLTPGGTWNSFTIYSNGIPNFPRTISADMDPQASGSKIAMSHRFTSGSDTAYYVYYYSFNSDTSNFIYDGYVRVDSPPPPPSKCGGASFYANDVSHDDGFTDVVFECRDSIGYRLIQSPAAVHSFYGPGLYPAISQVLLDNEYYVFKYRLGKIINVYPIIDTINDKPAFFYLYAAVKDANLGVAWIYRGTLDSILFNYRITTSHSERTKTDKIVSKFSYKNGKVIFNSSYSGYTSIKVYDISGKVVFNRNLYIKTGLNEIEIRLIRGLYIIDVNNVGSDKIVVK